VSLAQAIEAQIPQLRRFARLLTGSQRSGDDAVARALKAIIADPASFPDLPVRLGIYRYFLTAFTAGLEDAPAQVRAIGSTASRSLAALTPLARQAFLLASVEGFSTEETATILELPTARVSELLEEVNAEIARQIATDVLIIEDEPLIALDLKHILEHMGHRVLGIARTRREAVELATRKMPGLVMADVRLADGSSGLDAVNDLLAAFSLPIVFVTAYPERLLTGEKPEPTFLIPKPFRADAVEAIVNQVLFFGQHAPRR